MPRRGRFKKWRPVQYHKTRSNAKFKQRVKRIISSADESKFKDTNIVDSVPIAGTGTVELLTGIAQGDGENQRDGLQVKLTSIEMKYLVTSNAIASTNDTVVRILIVRTKNNQFGALLALASVLKTDSVTSLRAASDGSDMQQIKVYMDRTFVIPRTLTDVLPQSVYGQFYKSLGGLKCSYDGTGAITADTTQGHLYLLRLTNRAAGVQPGWEVQIRTRFKEM